MGAGKTNIHSEFTRRIISNVLGEGGFTNLLQKEDFEFLFDIEAQRV